MDDSRRPHVSNRRLFLLAGVLLVASFAGFVHIRTRQLPPLELFLHEDGTVSEGERSGKRILPDQIDLSLFDQRNPFRSNKVILHAPRGTPLVGWNATFEALVITGLNSFELRLGQETLGFHLPALDGNRHLTQSGSPVELIDLRNDPGADYEQATHNPDILVLADETTTVGQLLEATSPHRKEGVSLMVRGGGPSSNEVIEVPMMIRRRDEEFPIPEPTHPLASRIRMAFRFD